MRAKNRKNMTKKRHVLYIILSLVVLVGIFSNGIRMVQAIGEEGSETLSESELSTETTKAIGEDSSETLSESDQIAETTRLTERGRMSPDLANDLELEIDVKHTRTDVANFYNGERVNIVAAFSGADITVGDEYFIDVPFDKGTAEFTDNWSYFINVNKTAIDVKVGGTVVGTAVYDEATHKIKIVFSKDVDAADKAAFSLAANMAINESAVAGSQSLIFGVSGDVVVPVTIPTTKNGFVIDLKLSVTKASNYTGVNVTINFEALSGIGEGDYFEAAFVNYSANNGYLRLLFNNASEQVPIKKDGVQFGIATLSNGRRADAGNPKISFTFNQNLVETNIKGTASFTAQFTFGLEDVSRPRPTESKLVTYINGVPYEIPLEISPPSGNINNYKESVVHKNGGTGKVIKGRDDPVQKGEDFYWFHWRVSFNIEGLPNVNPPDGKVMKNAVITDSVEGPGQYILLGDDPRRYPFIPYGATSGTPNPIYNPAIANSVFRIHFVKDMSDDANLIYGSMAQWLPDSGFTSSYISIEQFMAKYPDRVTTVLYDDGSGTFDPKKVTSFTIDLGDLNAFAIELEYSSYIQEGSNDSIPSFRDYFYQSVMTSDKHSTAYYNTATLKSDKYVNESKKVYTYSTDASASMESGNLNLNIHKINESGIVQSGVGFTLYYGDGSSKAISTDAQGNGSFTQLGAGLYKLEEKTPKTGFASMKDIYFTIPNTIDPNITNIDLTNPIFNAYHIVDSRPVPITDVVYLDPNSNQITNHLGTGGFKITKVDADDRSIKLEGAEFLLYRMQGSIKQYYKVSDTGAVTWETDPAIATKLITDNDGLVAVTDLLYTTYYLEEITPPEDYEISAADNPIIILINNTYRTRDVTVKNNKIIEYLTDFTFRKVDAENSNIQLENAQFTIYTCGHQHDAICGGVADPKNCKHIHSDLVTNDPDCCWTVLETKVSDDEGLVTFKDLRSGTYQLVETKAPDGYQLPIGQWRLTVNAKESTVAISSKPEEGTKPPAFRNAVGDLEADYLVGNIKQYILPLTGGGSSWFMILGGLLTCGAMLISILWYSGRKRSRPDNVESG